jgi:glycosyltransferase involved in cell wall biosynthesis
MLSIIHVTDCFLPRLGGIEVQVAGLARAQQEAGEDVHVVTATRLASAPPNAGYTVHEVSMRLPWDLPVHPRAATHLDRIFRELAPEVVQVHVGAVSPFAWSAVRRAVRLNLPTVVVVHSMWDPAVQRVYGLLDRLTQWREAPLVLGAVSTAAARRMRADDVVVVPNGIEPAEWRRWPRGEHDDVHVVAVGRLASRKRPMALLGILEQVRRRGVRIRVSIAGDGPARSAMERYLKRHGMDWVRLVGRLDREGVGRLLASADIFVNPTADEAFGLAALEARTAGVPVVARTGTGATEFVRDGQEGLLCGSDAEMVDALVRLASDNEERIRIAEHNLSTEPEHCTWPDVLATMRMCRTRAQGGNAAETIVPVPWKSDSPVNDRIQRAERTGPLDS